MNERDTVVAPPVDWIRAGSDAELAGWAGEMETILAYEGLPTLQRANCQTIKDMIEVEQFERRARLIREVFGD